MIKTFTRTILLWFIFAASLAFAMLAVFVAEGATLAFDQSALQWINQFSSPALDMFFIGFTQLGGVIVVAAVAVALFVFFLYKKAYSKAALVALGVGGIALHGWAHATRTFQQLFGADGGTTGIDNDFAARGLTNVGAWILGRNMFGPMRGAWTDDTWKGSAPVNHNARWHDLRNTYAPN